MPDKYQVKKKAEKPKVSNKKEDNLITGKEASRNEKEPLFCFKYLDLNISLKGCDNVVYKHFLTRMQKISTLTWEEINKSNKHQYGFETIPKKKIRQRKFPSIVTEEMKELIAFRYSGDNKPFLCVIQSGIIYPVFIEANFGDVYDHGSK